MAVDQVFGLIGKPLGHSFSKKYFSDKFEKEGLHYCRFELFPLESIDDLPKLLASQSDIKGLAVTIPYKEKVIPFLDESDTISVKIGAVNCILVNRGRLTGYNTDAIGFERSLKPLLQPQHTRALVLGSGGASKAVRFVLDKLGIEYRVVSRNETNGKGYLNYRDVGSDILKTHRLIINCTPVGMEPDINDCPDLPYQFMNHNHLLYDLVYKPPMTLFLQKGYEQGAAIKNGYEMLIIQAEENWKIWQGLSAARQ